MDIKHYIGTINIAAALAIRRAVFIEDQNVPEELELDGLDSESEHYIGYLESEPISTARVRFFNGKSAAKIERVAVLSKYQGKGYGKILMLHILRQLEQQGIHEVCLEAQIHASGFYERFGFNAVGKVFMDANIPHIKMIKKL